MIRSIKNIISSKGYSFYISDFTKSQTILTPGGILRVKGRIRNNGFRLGTTYLVIKVADPYNHDTLFFNSNVDFDDPLKQTLRYVDISPFEAREFCCDIPLPGTIKRGVLDISLELWTPAKLFQESSTQRNTYLFHKTPWRGFAEIVATENRMGSVFISYSWHSEEHIEWVKQLSQELNKYKIETILDQKDLFPGEETTLFMEEGTTKQPVCLAICSTSYTEKANNRTRGVGYEISILTNEILEGRKRFTIIPVIRDNPTKKKPICFASSLHIDMDRGDWRAEPLSILVSSIKRATYNISK
jgi:TIR domain